MYATSFCVVFPVPFHSHHTCIAADKSVKIWDPSSGSLVRTLEGEHEYGLSDVAWSNNYLATASDDKTILIWDMNSVCDCYCHDRVWFASDSSS
jgi:WD40 repeat protein